MDSQGFSQGHSQSDNDAYASQVNNCSPYFFGASLGASIPLMMPPNGFQALLSSPGSPTAFRSAFPPNHGKSNTPTSQKLSPQSQGVYLDTTPQQNVSHQGASNVTKPCYGKKRRTGDDESNMRGDGRSSSRNRKRSKDTSIEVGSLQTKDKKDTKSKWPDYWVEHLIHVRAAMHDEFNKPSKQGVNLWSKVCTRLASLFSDFDKDSEACRKKWGRVYEDYKADKVHNSISGNDRKRSCKWYDIVDEYMHKRAHVSCMSHASALPSEHDQVLLSEGSSLPVNKEEEVMGDSATILTGIARGRGARKMHEVDASNLFESGKEMIAYLKESGERREALEIKKLEILSNFQANLAACLEKAMKD